MDAREYAASYSKDKNFDSITAVLMDAVYLPMTAALFALEVYRELPTVELRTAFLAELRSCVYPLNRLPS